MMLDKETHNGLDKEEIRNFLSMSIVNAYDKEVNSRKELPSSHNLKSYDWAIERTKITIQNQQNELEKLETIKAVIQLAKTHNWLEFDVSDYVSKSDNNRMYRNFFGTEKEYEKFMNENNFEY